MHDIRVQLKAVTHLRIPWNTKLAGVSPGCTRAETKTTSFPSNSYGRCLDGISGKSLGSIRGSRSSWQAFIVQRRGYPRTHSRCRVQVRWVCLQPGSSRFYLCLTKTRCGNVATFVGRNLAGLWSYLDSRQYQNAFRPDEEGRRTGRRSVSRPTPRLRHRQN